MRFLSILILLSILLQTSLYSKNKKEIVYFGVLPLENNRIMFKQFRSLAKYLSKKTGKKIVLKTYKIKKNENSYEKCVNDIGNNITQIAFLSPSTYLEANKKYNNVKPFVTQLIKGKPKYRSAIISKKDSTIKTFNDLKEKAFAFGNEKSTSSHLMPRSMLISNKVFKTLKKYEFLGSHDNVALAVMNGKFPAGGVKESVYSKNISKLHLIKISDEIPNFPICYNTSIDPHLLKSIKNALLELSLENNKKILTSINKKATGFAEISSTDYESVNDMIKKVFGKK